MTDKIEIEIPQINVYINFNLRIFTLVQFFAGNKNCILLILFCCIEKRDTLFTALIPKPRDQKITMIEKIHYYQ